MMDIGKIKSTGPQTVAPGQSTIIMSELVFEDPTGAVDASASGSTLSFSEAGLYLIVWEGLVVGTGDQSLYLSTTGSVSGITTLELIAFAGDAAGISHGKAIVLSCQAGSGAGLVAVNGGGGNVTYLCSLGAVKIADL